ncbi:MAG TPA: glycine betaine ABC transporter substrate-binding protein [Sedimentibacter sp.]|jgi:osmoprotectant transport system substrate-binding protein|nr:glycine betaine ABC transporter substrate-binding protein [Sedimentibacter sp.]HPY55926.1 glycine betaine ABC transporter substrate-binding protein [Sedimentibacter sp.]HQC69419.1 glycine betaine ABC transporter substrate-binding protein [Sedimentibacter sp.]HQO71254.1 glycine betaine ABC transporter substrate-binding protein [Sedimentibacter sp.]HQO94851.1 glycine betaine ABC transporter substrate-binding protein [Sedimentibacter sp.]
MKNKIKITTIFLIIIILLTNAAGCTGSNEENLEIRVGGKNFTEQYIMAEMFSILIEENTDLNTTLQTNLASTVLFEAIKADEVDLYLEYTGTGLINLGMEPLTDPDEVYKIVKTEYDKQFNIRWMQPYGFNNTYAMMVTRDTANKYGLETVSDLAEVAHEMTLGGSYVFTERADGYPGLSEHYGFEFDVVKGLDPSLMYQALIEGSVDVISGFATDGRIVAFDLVSLIDDKQFFPPYDATVIVRGEVLEKHPELEEILNRLANRIDDNKMAELNAAVDLDKREPADVAREFLEKEGLI